MRDIASWFPLVEMESSRNLWSNFLTTSIQFSGGIGREMANLIVDGAPSLDMFAYDIARYNRVVYATSMDPSPDSLRPVELSMYRGESRNLRKVF